MCYAGWVSVDSEQISARQKYFVRVRTTTTACCRRGSLRQSENSVDERDQIRFVVGDPTRQQSSSLTVDHHTMMVGFTYVDSRPELPHLHPFGRLPSRLKAWRTTSPSCPYTAISFASLNERSSHREHRAAILLQPYAQQKQKEPYPASPGSPEPTNIRPSPPSKTVRKQIERFSRRSEAEFISRDTAGGRAAGQADAIGDPTDRGDLVSCAGK